MSSQEALWGCQAICSRCQSNPRPDPDNIVEGEVTFVRAIPEPNVLFETTTEPDGSRVTYSLFPGFMPFAEVPPPLPDWVFAPLPGWVDVVAEEEEVEGTMKQIEANTEDEIAEQTAKEVEAEERKQK